MRRRRPCALGPGGDHHDPALGDESRRSFAGLRQRLPAVAQFLQRHARPLRRRGHLFRSVDRRRHRILFKPNTRAVLVEAPGSQSFEMPDIPAIAAVAHARNALVIDDNTWATPLYHRSLEHGVDISMQAATKYIGGHSDIMFGTISANAKAWPQLAEGIKLLGVCAGPDDVFLALRGIARCRCGWRSTTSPGSRWRAGWRHGPRSLRVLHPALETDPGHAIWKRDFTGASGLFSIVLKPAPQKAVDALLDTVKLFGMGFSWGGFESLVIPFDCDLLSHRNQMGAGRPDAAASYRARGCRGSQGRSRSRLCGVQRQTQLITSRRPSPQPAPTSSP